MTKTGGVRVSVCMVTYNQEKYIAQAIESVLMQKTDFKFQLLIGDDASTDKTPQIVREYAEKYPEIIKPVFHEKNIGAGNNSISLYKTVDTEYVAICDGDDYWVDENKLQKQVDFLDRNKGYNIVFTKSLVKYENQKQKKEYLPSKAALKGFYKRGYLMARDVIYYNDITPVSLMWRWKLKNGFPEGYSDKIMGDYVLNMIHAKDSKIAFLPFVSAVYRRHPASIWASVEDSAMRYKKYAENLINTQLFVKAYYKNKYAKDFNYVIQTIFDRSIDICIEKNDEIFLKRLITNYPQLQIIREKKRLRTMSPENAISKAIKRIKKVSHINFVLLLLQSVIIGLLIWLIIK